MSLNDQIKGTILEGAEKPRFRLFFNMSLNGFTYMGISPCNNVAQYYLRHLTKWREVKANAGLYLLEGGYLTTFNILDR